MGDAKSECFIVHEHWQSSCVGQAEGWARESREQGLFGDGEVRGWLERGFVRGDPSLLSEQRK